MGLMIYMYCLEKKKQQLRLKPLFVILQTLYKILIIFETVYPLRFNVIWKSLSLTDQSDLM